MEYTWTTGGDAYTDVKGYEMRGTITNLTQLPVKVKVRSNGSLRSSGNAFVDFGRSLTAMVTHQDRFEWMEKIYTLKPGERVSYKLSGACTRFVAMNIRFKVLEIKGIEF